MLESLGKLRASSSLSPNLNNCKFYFNSFTLNNLKKWFPADTLPDSSVIIIIIEVRLLAYTHYTHIHTHIYIYNRVHKKNNTLHFCL